MMSMMGAMMEFMVFGTLFFIMVLAVAIWLLVSFLNRRQTRPLPSTPPPQIPYQRYEQGYQPTPTMPETYREGVQHDPYPQPKQEFDQPSVLYPQEQEMPPQS